MRKALHILGILDDVDIEWMAHAGRKYLVSSGDVLIHEKKPINDLFILLGGRLTVIVGGMGGTHVATLLPGEIIGEISLVDSRPPSASVLAMEDSQVLAVGRDLLEAKLRADGAFAARFYRAVASFLADRLYVTVGRFGYGSAQQDVDVDELVDSAVEEVSLAAVRFDKLLKHLTFGNPSGSFAAAVL
ncbi:MAG: Cyclic nucleotide-binding protein [Candidatus Angelobacter sp.]|jgi:CRP-like cAMP-binding protein|nr:Cyclic nucleotide-binding protein [Candidatus Angelobacter sp.]